MAVNVLKMLLGRLELSADTKAALEIFATEILAAVMEVSSFVFLQMELDGQDYILDVFLYVNKIFVLDYRLVTAASAVYKCFRLKFPCLVYRTVQSLRGRLLLGCVNDL